MSNDFEDALEGLLRERAGEDQAAIKALAGSVAALPPRSRRPRRVLPLVASIAVLLGALWLLSPRLGSISNQPASTPTDALATSGPQKPSGPEAFAADPRLARCFGSTEDMEFVFEMARARDYRLFLPNMGISPELDVDDPALVVVYREGWVGPAVTGVPGAEGATPAPGRRFVCVVAGDADPTLYGDVDIEGLALAVQPSFTPPSPTPRPQTPGDPYAWLDDPRLHQCYFTGRPNQMDYVFELTPDRDYGLFLHNPGLEDELDADGPALVVVYRAEVPYPPDFGPDPGPQVPQTPPPGRRVVCIVFGNGSFSQTGLDITRLDINALPTSPSDGGSGNPPAAPVDPTPTPAPAWMAGAEAALSCTPADFKPDWTRGELATTGRGTPELAIAELAQRANAYGVPFPLEGFRKIGEADGAIAYGYVGLGAYRAIVVVSRDGTDPSARWWVDDVAVCQAAEVAPYAKTGVRSRRWTDATGAAADFSVVEQPDCYFGTTLTVEGRLFVWSPGDRPQDSYPEGVLEGPIGVLDAVPGDAVDSGYRSGDQTLFLSPDEKAAFILLPDGVQQWARVKGDDFQRTDCN